MSGGGVGEPEIEAAEATITLGDVIVIGGGCYGTFYARQLERARAKGKAAYRRVLLVDRDSDCQAGRELDQGQDRLLVVSEWGAFLDQYLGSSEGPRELSGPPVEDVIVPSPLMPHLMYEWLLRRARARWPNRAVETRSIPSGPGTPYDTTAPDATRYVSFADWLCPTHCIEPAVCPVIRAPRTWEMSDALAGLTARLNRDHATVGPVLFVCRHQVFAVGTFSVAAVRAGDAVVAGAGTAGTPVDVLVGTVSACHGALNLLHLGPD